MLVGLGCYVVWFSWFGCWVCLFCGYDCGCWFCLWLFHWLGFVGWLLVWCLRRGQVCYGWWFDC